MVTGPDGRSGIDGFGMCASGAGDTYKIQSSLVWLPVPASILAAGSCPPTRRGRAVVVR